MFCKAKHIIGRFKETLVSLGRESVVGVVVGGSVVWWCMWLVKKKVWCGVVWCGGWWF
jgi:hypothetical protein